MCHPLPLHINPHADPFPSVLFHRPPAVLSTGIAPAFSATIPYPLQLLSPRSPLLLISFPMHPKASPLTLLASLLSNALLSLASPVAAPAAEHLVARNYASSGSATSCPPKPTGHDWARGAVTEFPLHESCNSTERAILQRAFGDGVKLALHAKEHILRYGNSSGFYQRYFGKAATAEPIGWYERIAHGDRAGLIFRCDDPDRNCRLNPSKSPSSLFHPSCSSSPSLYSVLELTTWTIPHDSMGRPLARLQRNQRNGHLPAVVHDALVDRAALWPWLPRRRRQPQRLLRRRHAAPLVPPARHGRGCGRPLHARGRGRLRRKHRACALAPARGRAQHGQPAVLCARCVRL